MGEKIAELNDFDLIRREVSADKRQVAVVKPWPSAASLKSVAKLVAFKGQ